MSFLSYTKEYEHNLLMLLVRSHERYMPIVEFFDSMTQNLSELSWAEAEMIAAKISKGNGSEFCIGIRGGMAQALEVGEDVLNGDKFQVLVKFALKVAAADEEVFQEDVDAVLAAGWSEQTVEDVVGLVAIQGLYNTIATGLGFKQLPVEAFAEIGKGTVQSGGYVNSLKHFIAA